MLRRLLRTLSAPPPDASILVVCMENICRSPMAEGALRQAANRHNIRIDSAGVLVSAPRSVPDVRAVHAAHAWDIDIRKSRSKRITSEDFCNYDYILVADQPVLERVETMRPSGATAEIALFLSFAGKQHETELPDPYFGTRAGFDVIMQLIGEAAPAVIERVLREKSMR